LKNPDLARFFIIKPSTLVDYKKQIWVGKTPSGSQWQSQPKHLGGPKCLILGEWQYFV